LRLDEIRQRLSTMDEAGLNALLIREPHPEPSQAAPVVQLPESGFPVVTNPGHTFIHYALPHGITLVVPSGLNGNGPHLVELLLASAARILGGQPDAPGIHRNLC
jgi:16S rRNA C1402 (ribose-2'-O) methylase RsmI